MCGGHGWRGARTHKDRYPRWHNGGYRIRGMTVWRRSTTTFRLHTSQKRTSTVRTCSPGLAYMSHLLKERNGSRQRTQNLLMSSGRPNCNAGSTQRISPSQLCLYTQVTSCQVGFPSFVSEKCEHSLSFYVSRMKQRETSSSF